MAKRSNYKKWALIGRLSAQPRGSSTHCLRRSERSDCGCKGLSTLSACRRPQAATLALRHGIFRSASLYEKSVMAYLPYGSTQKGRTRFALYCAAVILRRFLCQGTRGAVLLAVKRKRGLQDILRSDGFIQPEMRGQPSLTLFAAVPVYPRQRHSRRCRARRRAFSWKGSLCSR